MLIINNNYDFSIILMNYHKNLKLNDHFLIELNYTFHENNLLKLH